MEPKLLSSAGSSSPQIAVDPAGNATAVWIYQNRVQGSTKLYNEPNWSEPTFISTTSASNPRIAVDSDGNVTVLWTQSFSIRASMKLINETTWSPPQTLSHLTWPSLAPNVVAYSGERAQAVWRSITDGTSLTQSATYYPNPTVTSLSPSSGPKNGGTSVRIHGTHFTEVTNVFFGELPSSSFTVLSTQEIEATAPSGTVGSSVHVTVTASLMTSEETSADLYTFLSSPPAAPSRYTGTLHKRYRHHRVRPHKYSLHTKWRSSPSSDVLGYTIYSGNTAIHTSSASSSNTYRIAFSSRYKRTSDFSKHAIRRLERTYSIRTNDIYGENSTPTSLHIKK